MAFSLKPVLGKSVLVRLYVQRWAVCTQMECLRCLCCLGWMSHNRLLAVYVSVHGGLDAPWAALLAPHSGCAAVCVVCLGMWVVLCGLGGGRWVVLFVVAGGANPVVL